MLLTRKHWLDKGKGLTWPDNTICAGRRGFNPGGSCTSQPDFFFLLGTSRRPYRSTQAQCKLQFFAVDMVWLKRIRSKWCTSVGNLLQAKGKKGYAVVLEYPAQLFNGRPNQSPANEEEEDAFEGELHPPTRQLHTAFEYLLLRLYHHKDLALPVNVKAGMFPPTQPPSPTVPSSQAKPTLAAQVRHFKLSKLIVVVDKLIVMQEKLFRRLEKQANWAEWVQDSLQHLFQVLEKECDKIQQLSMNLSSEREDRFQMETDINALTDSLQEILTSFGALTQAWTDVVGHVAANVVEVQAGGDGNPWPDVDTVTDLRRGLPERYTVDYVALCADLASKDGKEWNFDPVQLAVGAGTAGLEGAKCFSRASVGTLQDKDY
ncbi:uncharacterized protein LOC110980744 [Acanthaster planci]|uniref:Uncharacterized protein LOC110980744 n=1 Tax=Acanthaster planci TaxID=133434 RepID=A0A8B7YLQ6_ACAPL|nr:uncharacterized protein LOC110980744 [Acanthaster planci]